MAVKNYISIFSGNSTPMIYDLDLFGKDFILIGRGAYHGEYNCAFNDIVIEEKNASVSRRHCIIRKINDHWEIIDENSLNGIWLNGNMIQSRKLQDGDRYYIGTSNQNGCILAYNCIQESNATTSIQISANAVSLWNKEKYMIGRSEDCDIVIHHPSVSRYHCIIERNNNGFLIYDNHSKNGIRINGYILRDKYLLRQMDRITIADVSLVFNQGFLYSTTQSGGVSVEANNICKIVKTKFGEKYITDHVSLSIEPGEFVAIIGGSGAGKTTLLNCLSGMTNITYGDILVGGESLKKSSRSIRSIIGYVPQNDTVYDDLTLERMLYYSAKLRMPKDMTKEDIHARIDEILRTVELENHRYTMIGKLSGGQKKRASIAVELLASPKLFFLDEPFSGLDPGTEKKLMLMLKRLALSGKTVIMVTHTVQNIDLCDRVICMGNGGKLCYSGTPQETLSFFNRTGMTDIYEILDEHADEYSYYFNGMQAPKYMDSHVTEELKIEKRAGVSGGLHQLCILTKRYAELSWNRRGRLMLLLFMPLLLAMFICVAYQLDGGIKNHIFHFVNDILPFGKLDSSFLEKHNFPFAVVGDTRSFALAMSCAGFWIGIFNSIQEISKEESIYRREQFTGLKVLPYLLSKIIICTVLCIVQAALMLTVIFAFSKTVVTFDGNINSPFAYSISLNAGGQVFTNSMWLELYCTTFFTLFSAMCVGLVVSSAVSNDMALVMCPICLLPQILFSNVVSSLSGIAEKISKIITCKWSTIAYCTSMDINHMLKMLYFDNQMGTWNQIPLDNGIYSTDYAMETTGLFHLNPILNAWVYLGIIAFTSICLAIVLLKMKYANGRRKR